MTPSDHTTTAALDRISRAMDRQPRFINVRTGGNLPRDRMPLGLCLTLSLCISAEMWVAGWWLVFG